MSDIIPQLDTISSLKIKEMETILRSIGCTYSFKTKDRYVSRLESFKKCVDFTWRKDQKRVIEEFLRYEYNYYVIHAVFGSGKTTLLMGMLVHGLLEGLFKPWEVMFISFNISIRNELRRKMKEYGINGKVKVRTFDSLIYEICKVGDYPYLDLPNFEGKRKFAYELCYNPDFTFLPSYQPSIVFIDECQDLERSTLTVLKRFYPHTKFVFSGDIFQSIQKEPRESILWYFMTTDVSDTYKIYMNETPRVPSPVLNSIQSALHIYYPEFKEKISSWRSGNKVSNVDIQWKQLHSYTQIFEKVKKFTDQYKPEEAMILTFSSAITVKGAMGDLARIRRFMVEQNLPVNTNHKRMDPSKYFLSTANSSKGLERDYVIIFLTFPLERAFINLSDDIVVNLITVALSRAKKKVIMYVPSYEDKYSRVLTIFQKCPSPDRQRIREGKLMKEFAFSDYLNIEHSVTELIRMSIVKYDTRIQLKEFVKPFEHSSVFQTDINYKVLPIITDEEKAFVGVLIENLITSTWKPYWPHVDSFDELQKNPMYVHVMGYIKKAHINYVKYTKSTILDVHTQFQGIYLYSQIHIALSNKIFMNLTPQLIANLKTYWSHLRPQCYSFKPQTERMQVQARLQMPWVTGVADVLLQNKGNEGREEVELVEIKASQDFEWKDNALLQVLIYSLMTGKSWSRLHLINPFRNEKVSYYFDSKKIVTLRNKVIQDVLIYNMNSFMAKLYSISKEKNPIDVSNTLFIDVKRDDEGSIVEASILNMVSPIKCELVYNGVASSKADRTRNMAKIEKMRCESNSESTDIELEVKRILESPVNQNKMKVGIYSDEELGIEGITDLLSMGEEAIFDHLKYEKDPDKKYGLNWTESFYRNLGCLSYMFMNFRFT